MTKIPLRDLSLEEQRGLIGLVVTVQVYETAEDKEPSTILSGRLAVLGIAPKYTIVVFEHQPDVSPLPASNPVTVTW